jgi:hypothetical protein
MIGKTIDSDISTRGMNSLRLDEAALLKTGYQAIVRSKAVSHSHSMCASCTGHEKDMHLSVAFTRKSDYMHLQLCRAAMLWQ